MFVRSSVRFFRHFTKFKCCFSHMFKTNQLSTKHTHPSPLPWSKPKSDSNLYPKCLHSIRSQIGPHNVYNTSTHTDTHTHTHTHIHTQRVYIIREIRSTGSCWLFLSSGNILQTAHKHTIKIFLLLKSFCLHLYSKEKCFTLKPSNESFYPQVSDQ